MFSFAKKFVDRLEGNSDELKKDSYFKSALQLNNKGYALRVLNVIPHSLAHQLGFESWFDYIVRVNHHELPMMYPSLSNYTYSINDDGSINYGGDTTQEQAGMISYDVLLKELVTIAHNENGSKSVTLDVWSAKGGVIRQIKVPLDKFDESKRSETTDESVQDLYLNNIEQIGFTLQSQHLNTATYVWRILTTHSGSPAFQAQLVPHADYIIGCDTAFNDDINGKGLLSKGGESLLSRTVLSYYNFHYSRNNEDNVPITLYVYNHDYDVLRPVTVNLSRSWGSGHNKGILGCDVGYGLLHRIPEVIGKFDSNELVDDILFQSDQTLQYDLNSVQPETAPPSQETANLVTPMADNDSTPGVFVPQPLSTVSPPPRSLGARKKKASKGAASLAGLNLDEEFAKSKEADIQYGSTDNGSLPPPPPPPKLT